MFSILLMATTFCLTDACSNDSLVPPVIGDETVVWDMAGFDETIDFQFSTNKQDVCWTGTPDFYLECLDRGPKGHCRQWKEGGVWFSSTQCAPRHNERVCVHVRACRRSTGKCGEWSEQCVEFVGHPWVEFRAGDGGR